MKYYNDMARNTGLFNVNNRIKQRRYVLSLERLSKSEIRKIHLINYHVNNRICDAIKSRPKESCFDSGCYIYKTKRICTYTMPVYNHVPCKQITMLKNNMLIEGCLLPVKILA